MNFDGTVTIGTLLTVAGAMMTLLSAIIVFVGSKYFPTKIEMAAFKTDIKDQIATLRQDVHNAVGSADTVGRREGDRIAKDLERVENAVAEAFAEARAARSDAKDAQHTADRAKNGVAKIEKDDSEGKS